MRTRIDPQALRQIIERGGLRFRNGPQSWVFTCPRCQKKDKLYIRKRDGRYRCMKCGPDYEGYDTDLPLHELSGTARADLRETLFGAKSAGTAIETFQINWVDYWGEFGVEPEEDAPEPAELIWSPDIVDIESDAAGKGRAYLEGRGIPLETARRYGIRYNPSEQRVVFPITRDGTLYGWQSRFIGQTDYFDEENFTWYMVPKMLTVGAVGGKLLMFGDRLKGSEHAVMAEGPVDAIKCDLCGGNVATMGKGVSRRQMDLIAKAGIRKLYVGLDPDAADDIMRVVTEMSMTDIQCYRLEPPRGASDLGASSPEAVLEQFRSAPRILPGQLYVHFSRAWP